MKLFERLQELNIQPNPSIARSLGSGSYPFSDNLVLGTKNSEDLAFEEYKRCLDLYNERMNSQIGVNSLALNSPGYGKLISRYMSVMEEITVLESSIKDELVKMSEDAIRMIYDIPEDVDLQGFIEPEEDDENPFNPKDCQDEDECMDDSGIPEDRKRIIEEEADKRVILNTLSHGSSVHIWKTAYYIIKDQVEALNPRLVELYDEYSVIVSILLWQYDAPFMENAIRSGNQINQGHNRVEWASDDEEEDILLDDDMQAEYEEYLKSIGEDEEEDYLTGVAVAINTPVLLHELNKCAFEILIMHSIPVHFNQEELQYYYSIADNYYHEMWHYYLGPSVWVKLLSAITEAEMKVSEVIMSFSQISYEELGAVINACIKDKETGAESLQMLMSFFED